MATVDGINTKYFSLQLKHKPELQVAIEGYTSNRIAIMKI